MAFREAQMHYYVDEVQPIAEFYGRIGFVESFRTPTQGPPDHLEMRLGGFCLGFTTRAAVAQNVGLQLAGHAPVAEVAVWCDDVDAVVEDLSGRGVRVLAGPRDHRGGRVAWLSDPAGNPVHLVQAG